MRRLRALYWYVTQPITPTNFCNEYPVAKIQATVDRSGRPVAFNQTSIGLVTYTATDSLFLLEPSRVICSWAANKQAGRVIDVKNLSFCGHAEDIRSGDLYINPRLKHEWLIYATPEGSIYELRGNKRIQLRNLPASAIPLGAYSRYSLYARDELGYAAYHEFILFILEASASGSTVGQSGTNSSGKGQQSAPYAAPVPSLGQ
jgi:hypothetical protein